MSENWILWCIMYIYVCVSILIYTDSREFKILPELTPLQPLDFNLICPDNEEIT